MKFKNEEVENMVKNMSEDEFVKWAIEVDYELGSDNGSKKQKFLYSRAIEQKHQISTLISKHPEVRPALDIINDIVIEFNKVGLAENDEGKRKLLFRILHRYIRLRNVLVECGLQ